MKLTMVRAAALAALLSLSLAPARADYQGLQAGGGTITYGAFAPTLGGVVTQLTKSVPVDPVTGAAIFTSSGPGYVSIVGTPAVTVTGVATAAAQATGNGSLATLATTNGGLTDAAWDGTAASASHTSILKTISAKLAGLLSVDTVVRSTSVDRGGTITAGGSAQQFMPANANRRGFLMQNQSTADLYVNCVATAAANQSSLRIPAGALYETSPHHSGTGACSVFGATSAQAFYAREF